MSKRDRIICSFLVFAILIITVHTRIMQIKCTDASDRMIPNFEIKNLNETQKDEIPAEHLQFYEKVKDLSFKSDNIHKESYSVDFEDLPFIKSNGILGVYRYFMDQGKVYDAGNDKSSIGYFSVRLIRVGNVKLLHNKIQLSVKASSGGLLCSYVKLVYLSFGGGKKIKYIPLEDEASIVIDSHEKGYFLKAIYIFSAAEKKPAMRYQLKDYYNGMKIE